MESLLFDVWVSLDARAEASVVPMTRSTSDPAKKMPAKTTANETASVRALERLTPLKIPARPASFRNSECCGSCAMYVPPVAQGFCHATHGGYARLPMYGPTRQSWLPGG